MTHCNIPYSMPAHLHDRCSISHSRPPPSVSKHFTQHGPAFAAFHTACLQPCMSVLQHCALLAFLLQYSKQHASTPAHLVVADLTQLGPTLAFCVTACPCPHICVLQQSAQLTSVPACAHTTTCLHPTCLCYSISHSMHIGLCHSNSHSMPDPCL
jgi:hypothetical protein